MEASLASGVTTIIGQEFGPVWGVGVNSPWALRTAFASFDAWPVNIGFLGPRLVLTTRAAGRGARRGRRLRLQGARGHGGARPGARHGAARRRRARRAGGAPHRRAQREPARSRTPSPCSTDAPSTRSTSRAAAAATRPTSWSLAGVPNVIGSSTNPTLPFGRDAVAEHLDMIIAGARAEPRRPERPGHGPRPDPRTARWAPRTCCTTWASSRSPPPTPRGWDGRARPSGGRSAWPRP